MEFRWIALIAIWTLISGPMLGEPLGLQSATEKPKKEVIKKVAPVAPPMG